MVKRVIALSDRKKIAARDLGLQVSFENDLLKKITFDKLKLRDSLLKQGMAKDHGIQLKLQQTSIKRITKLMFGTVGAPENPSSYKELVSGSFTRPKATLMVYNLCNTSENVGKISGYANVLLPTAEDNLNILNKDGKGRSLLSILLNKELGQKIYELDINHEIGPTLYLNAGLNNNLNPKKYFYDNKPLLSVILQGALSEIFDYIMASDDETSWETSWIEFCEEKKISCPKTEMDLERRREIIKEIVDQFALDHLMLEASNKYIREKEGELS